MKKEICIIGAGLCGSLMARYLGNKGFSVHVYEKRDDLRNPDSIQSRGRSIAMSLSCRGWNALKEVGLYQEIRKMVVPQYGRLIHNAEGGAKIQSYSFNKEAIYIINRRDFNSKLISHAEKTGKVKFHFNTELKNINLETGDITLKDLKTGDVLNKTYRNIIGADGINSQVRKYFEDENLIQASMEIHSHGYKEINIPTDLYGNYTLRSEYVNVWPSESSFFIAFPTVDKTFNGTLCISWKGQNSFAEIDSEEKVMSLFSSKFPSSVKYIPDLVNEYFNNPTSNITTLNCSEWNYKNKVLLMGDACHAISPFYGMGMNTTFEDCSVFNALLDKTGGDIDYIFENFTRIRKKNTDIMGVLSLKHYKHLSSQMNSDYYSKWNLERVMYELFPSLWTPQYNLVAFTNTPYTEVVEITYRQDKILTRILSEGKSELLKHSKEFQEIIQNELMDFALDTTPVLTTN